MRKGVSATAKAASDIGFCPLGEVMSWTALLGDFLTECFMPSEKEAAIFYGAFINPKANWRKLIRAQLLDLRRFGALPACDLYVTVTNHCGVDGVQEFFEGLPISIKHIEYGDENKFEYPALATLWRIVATNDRYKYVGYLHTKGMSYAQNQRIKVEKVLTYFTFSAWTKVFQIFESHPDINKIGIFPSMESGKPCGGLWFNFWWARSSLIRALPMPVETKDRYYYEHWIGSLSRKDPPILDVHSLYTSDKTLFTGQEAIDHLTDLRKRMKYKRHSILDEIMDLFIDIRRMSINAKEADDAPHP